MMRFLNTSVCIALALTSGAAHASDSNAPNYTLQTSAFAETRQTNNSSLYFVEGSLDIETRGGRFGLVAEGRGEVTKRFQEAESKLFYQADFMSSLSYSLGMRADYADEDFYEYAFAALHGELPFSSVFDSYYFVSPDGDQFGRFIVSNTISLSENWNIDTALEYNLSFQDDPDGIGGITDGEFASRLHYQVSQNLALYAGYLREFEVGDQAKSTRGMGEATNTDWIVLGISGEF